MLLAPFDPWKSPLCTCPPKLTFNPYTGCDHGCLYCYASSYIPHFHECRPKKDLITRLKREASKLNGELVSISNSSDPYPRLDKKLGLTRKSLEILANNSCRIQIITKSDLVTRDIDILQTVPSGVSITILTLSDFLSKKLEPAAPASSKRLIAIKKLVNAKIPTTVRIDPIIPFLNDDLEPLVKAVTDLGVLHVTCSTYKIKPDNWKRFSLVFPEVAEKLKPQYFSKSEHIAGSTYLPKTFRFSLMKQAKQLVEQHGLKFGCCRENFNLNSAFCDGSWVVPDSQKKKSKQLFFS
ncbi:MAG: radical SAM protein [Candidatus Bathyarchaeum tardum]|nr:MAG: radical SAM protein [Candidatus Bathyarchaeum tardum]